MHEPAATIGSQEPSVEFEQLLRDLAAFPPRVVAADVTPEVGVPALGQRYPVAIGGGFPRGSGITGLSLEKYGASASPVARSLSEFVFGAEEELFSSGTLGALHHHSVQELVNGLGFFVKDASPDSLLTVFLVFARLRGVKEPRVLTPWVRAVTDWDLGVMPANPFRSWPALASALSHSRIPSVATEEQPDLLRTAWNDGFALLLESLLAIGSPENVPENLTGTGRRALSALRRLERLYENIHTHATVLQVSVPLLGAPDRRVTVDALCYVEDEPNDAVKLFARGDLKRSPSKTGFGMAASYRPTAADWNRYTISVDPGAGLDLSELWMELERRETRASIKDGRIMRRSAATTPSFAEWQSDPSRPRSFEPADLDLLAVKQGEARQLSGVENYWVNPWFIFPNRSLVASPGKDNGGVGAGASLLEWRDVINAMWMAFHPLSGIMVEACIVPERREFATCELLLSPAIPFDSIATSQSFRYVRWRKREHKPIRNVRPIEVNDTTVRSLAALAATRQTSSVNAADLPPRAACRLVELTGGFAVLAYGGCIVVDDWRDEPLAEVSVLDSLRKMAQACADQVLQLDRLAAFERRFQEWQQAGRPEERAFDLVGAVVGARAEFSLVRVSASGALIADANARTLYESLRDFWATTEREKHVDEALSRLERSIRALQDARPARLLRFIALFGFPAFVAPNISKPLVAVGNLAFLRLGVTVSDSARTSAALLSGAEGVLWVIVTLVLYGLLRRVLDRWDPTARPAKDA